MKEEIVGVGTNGERPIGVYMVRGEPRDIRAEVVRGHATEVLGGLSPKGGKTGYHHKVTEAMRKEMGWVRITGESEPYDAIIADDNVPGAALVVCNSRFGADMYNVCISDVNLKDGYGQYKRYTLECDMKEIRARKEDTFRKNPILVGITNPGNYFAPHVGMMDGDIVEMGRILLHQGRVYPFDLSLITRLKGECGFTISYFSTLPSGEKEEAGFDDVKGEDAEELADRLFSRMGESGILAATCMLGSKDRWELAVRNRE